MTDVVATVHRALRDPGPARQAHLRGEAAAMTINLVLMVAPAVVVFTAILAWPAPRARHHRRRNQRFLRQLHDCPPAHITWTPGTRTPRRCPVTGAGVERSPAAPPAPTQHRAGAALPDTAPARPPTATTLRLGGLR